MLHSSSLVECGDNRNFYIAPSGQCANLHQFPGWGSSLIKVGRINRVDAGKIIDVGDKNRSFDDVFERKPSFFQNGLDVQHHPGGFGFDGIGDEDTCSWVQGDLAGGVQGVIVDDGLAIGANGIGSLGGFDDFFHGVGSPTAKAMGWVV